MKTETRVLEFLLENRPAGGATIRQISDKTGADYKIVHTAVTRLLAKGVLAKRKVGKSIEVTLSGRLSEDLYEAEIKRRNTILKSKDMKVIVSTVKQNMGTSFFTLVLFGSYAKGTQTKRSDIDLMVVVPDKAGLEGNAESAFSLIPLSIHPMVLTESQFRSMVKSRESSVVTEAMASNVILYGLEQYYEMIG